MFSFCPNSIRLLSKRAWDHGFFSLSLSLFSFQRGASHDFWGVRAKLSPHHFILYISSPHANTLISIRFCSGQPGSHDISQAKESTERLCSSQEKPLLLVAFHPWWWCYTHHHVTLWHTAMMATVSLKNYKELFTSVWNLTLSKSTVKTKHSTSNNLQIPDIQHLLTYTNRQSIKGTVHLKTVLWK